MTPDHPKLMAIGDSMYQGVRSLTFTEELAEIAPPAQIARRVAAPMRLQTPPRPILFDLEAEIRGRGGLLSVLGAIRAVAAGNLRAWLDGRPWSLNTAFENISIGGFTIDDLWLRTAGDSEDRLPEHLAALDEPSLAGAALFKRLGQTWMDLATAYALNPSGRDDRRGLSAVDQVVRRQPEALLVNIGSNEGLFEAGLSGALSDAGRVRIGQIPQRMAELAERLAALPANTRIYVNSLIRPRIIPNLAPRSDNELYPRPGDGYFARYVPELGASGHGLSGDEMSALDELVRDVCRRSEVAMRETLGDRLRWVDLYSASDQFDGKHWEDRYVAIKVSADNEYRLRPQPLRVLPGLGFQSGGLGSLDNMHLTMPGYALIADEVIKKMKEANDPLVTGRDPAPLDLAEAYRRDTLLTNLPRSWAWDKLLIGFARDLGLLAPSTNPKPEARPSAP